MLTLISGNAAHYRFLLWTQWATWLSAYYEYWSSRWLRLSVRLRRTTQNIWQLTIMFST